MKEGSRVTYVGDAHPSLVVGDQGRVLVYEGNAVHIQWVTGSRKSQVDMLDPMDVTSVVKQGSADGMDDSLDIGTMVVTSARDVFDTEGEVGLLNLMADHGHLAAFQLIASTALIGIQADIRADPSFRAVMAQLEDEEADSLVRLASLALLRDAFGTD